MGKLFKNPGRKISDYINLFLEKTGTRREVLYIIASIKYYFRGLYLAIDNHHILLFSAGLAFSLFICIIPFILILFWILGNFLDSNSVKNQIDTFIYTVIPYEEYADFVQQLIFSRISEVIQYKNLVGWIGLGGLLFAASGFSGSIRTILNKIFGAAQDVNILLGTLRDFALVFVSIVIFLVTAILLPLLNVLREVSDVVMELKVLNRELFQNMFSTVFSFLLLTCMFSILYYFVPIVKIKLRSVIIGALWAAGMWEGMRMIFGYYLFHFAAYGQIYGAYAIVAAIAFWIYYSSAVFIVGAEIGKLYNDNPLRGNFTMPVKKDAAGKQSRNKHKSTRA